MKPESNHFDSTLGRGEAIEAIRREYGQVTFYDSTTVIAGGKKHRVPEGTTYISGQTGARPEGHAISGVQSSLSSNYQRPIPAIEEGVRRRREAIEAIRHEYGKVTFYDSTTVIAGGKKHKIPEGSTYLSGQTGARQEGYSVSEAQSSLSSSYKLSKPGTEENVIKRREAIEAIRREYGEVTFYDSTTVIAGGKKHQVPEGTVFESAPAEWKVGPRGGIYKEWYSPRSGRSYRDYQK